MKPSVLLVDDDALTLEMLQATLEADYALQRAGNSQEALALAAAQAFDLIVLDVDMPGPDGYACCRALKQGGGPNAATPVIFHSALTGVDERLRGFEAGGEDYLAKPFEPAVLQAKVRQVLGHAQRQRELSQQLDEAMGVALTTADMVGETGVVLDFQRQASSCGAPEALGRALLEALQRFGFDGVVRVRGRHQTFSLNLRGPASALESSLLDHLAAAGTEPRVRAIGPHTGFHWGAVLLFVRQLPLQRDALPREEAERLARVQDNIALLMEGAALRAAALDSEGALRDLGQLRELVGQTQEALSDLSARGHVQQAAVAALCSGLAGTLEARFIHLGLTHEQEDQLAELVNQHRSAVMAELAKQQDLEQALQQIIGQLRGQL